MEYYGTKLGQDSRFKNPDKEILSSMKVPKSYKTTVSKHNLIILPIIKLWLNKKILEILEFEDETLANLIINIIKSSNEKIDPKSIQYQISGFLGDKTYSFMKEFWKLLINVQELYLKDKTQIPNELIPFQQEYEKRRQYYLANIRKNEKEGKNIDDINSNFNDKDDFDGKEYEEYKIKEKYNERKYSRSNSREKKIYKSRSRSRSRKRSRSHRKRDEREKYKTRKYDKSRSRNERYKSRSRSINYRTNKHRRDDNKNYHDYDDYYKNKSKINKNDKKSLSRSESSETLKLDKSVSLSRSSENYD